MRWGYVFSEFISPNAGIDNVPGVHVPEPEEPKFDEQVKKYDIRSTTMYDRICE